MTPTLEKDLNAAAPSPVGRGKRLSGLLAAAFACYGLALWLPLYRIIPTDAMGFPGWSGVLNLVALPIALVFSPKDVANLVAAAWCFGAVALAGVGFKSWVLSAGARPNLLLTLAALLSAGLGAISVPHAALGMWFLFGTLGLQLFKAVSGPGGHPVPDVN